MVSQRRPRGHWTFERVNRVIGVVEDVKNTLDGELKLSRVYGPDGADTITNQDSHVRHQNVSMVPARRRAGRSRPVVRERPAI